MKSRLKKTIIGFLVATLPTVVGLLIAGLLLLTAAPTTDPDTIDQRQRGAATVRAIGYILTGVAWSGMILYAISSLYEYLFVQRYARRIERLRQQGKI